MSSSSSSNPSVQVLSQPACKRSIKDIAQFQKVEHKEIFLKVKDDSLLQIKALFFGPIDSVYEGGVFLFDIVPPNDYPHSPPKVKFTTPMPNERLHPNLYGCGKCCLSILGTWDNYEWSPLLSFEKVLLTIQALLDENPLPYEPGFDKLKLTDERALKYSVISRWLTLGTTYRWLTNINGFFYEEIKTYFVNNFEIYMKSFDKLKEYDGKILSSMHNMNVQIRVSELKTKYEKIYNELISKYNRSKN